jgi:Putative beta barrel porin-7 (BBP7)
MGAPRNTRDEEFTMKKECLASLAALLTGAGLSLAQPAPALLATPAPNVHARGASATLPADLPPTGDSTSANHGNPGVFPFPGTGVYETPGGCVTELPLYIEPTLGDASKKGKDCDPARCHVWASAEPLLWWVRQGSTPTLVTAGGDGSLDYGLLVGGRVAAGFVNAAGDLGLEGSGFWLSRGSAHFTVASGPDGSPALGRPIYDALLQQSQVLPISIPGALAGGLAVASTTQLWGAETNVVGNAFGSDWLGIDLLGGLRYVGLDESLVVTQSGTSLTGAGNFGVTDSFRTRNQFYGGQVGSQVEMRFGRIYTNLVGKVAVGNVHQIVDVAGNTTVSGPGGSATLPGGVLALGTNSGHQTHDDFGVVPELNLNVGCQLRPGIRLYAGYTFLYLNDVARPGDQVSTTVNPALVPTSPQFGTPSGPPQPGAQLNRTDFWTQGVNIGLALRY